MDYELVTLSGDIDLYDEAEASLWWTAPSPFAALANLVADRGPHHTYAHSIVGLWRDILTPLSDGASALFVGHSGELEVALVACFPDADRARGVGRSARARARAWCTTASQAVSATSSSFASQTRVLDPVHRGWQAAANGPV